MKKRILIFAALIIIAVSSVVYYRSYTNIMVKNYVSILSTFKPLYDKVGLAGEVKLEKVIKKSPVELVMLVKWGEDEVFVSIDNWLTKKHHKITVKAFDSKKWFIGME